LICTYSTFRQEVIIMVNTEHNVASNIVVYEANANYKKSIFANYGAKDEAELEATIEEIDSERPGPVGTFVRGSRDSAYQDSGITSRLSTVIRRSLRLAPKRQTTVRLAPCPIDGSTTQEWKHLRDDLGQVIFRLVSSLCISTGFLVSTTVSVYIF